MECPSEPIELWPIELQQGRTAKPIMLVLVKLANQVQQKDAPIKESKGPIVIDTLDPSDVEKISRGTAAKDHNAQSSISAPENFQPTWCPSGLSRTQKCKLQRVRCKKLKQ